MNMLETFRVALRALLRNKMRAFLTMLGIIIGVGAVITMVAIGEGAKSQVEAAFASMGTNLLIVLPGSSTQSGARGGFGSQPTLTWEDLRAMQSEVPSIKYAVPVLRSSTSVLSEDANWTTSVSGTTPAYFDVRSWPMMYGSRFTDSDVESGTKTVVLGATVSEKLFGESQDPTGQVVRLKNIPFVVVAVAAKKGQSPMGQDYDDAVFIPVTTFQTKIQGGLGKFLAGQVMVSAVSSDSTARAEKDLTGLLRDRHHLTADADDDFSVRNLAEIANSQAASTDTLTTLLACVAAVSLLVGGIGIMNIMLVSVTERTREIGVRMAIGARPPDILAQFLIEALALALVGGLIGVLSGVLGSRYIAHQLHWPVLIRLDVIGISVCFSALVGVVFGLYPARKASQLDPIDALRYE